MTWSGPGVPVIGGQVLSGAQTIVFKGSRYLLEHQMPGMEGGIVENYGKPQPRFEFHGIVYESGADQMLASLSGLIGSTFQEVHVPSFNSGYYFIASGTGLMFEKLQFIYDAGYGYPYYHYVIQAVGSGEVGIPNVAITSAGITYVMLNVVNAQLYGTYVGPFSNINAQISLDYIGPFSNINTQLYGDYMRPNIVNGQTYGNYISNVSGNHNSGGTGY